MNEYTGFEHSFHLSLSVHSSVCKDNKQNVFLLAVEKLWVKIIQELPF